MVRKASASLKGEQVFAYDESRKLGITSSVFLILNKMIGTGSECHPQWIRSESYVTDHTCSILYAVGNL